jgi:valyl-tRNA synthetase
MNLDMRRIEGARNFANKLWQAGRFILGNLDKAEARLGELLLEDRWILSRLNRLTGEVAELMDTFQYGEAGRRVRDFLWDEFCDWYIEAAKVRLYDEAADQGTPLAVLLTVLEQSLRLLHPFMPYATEALWQALPASVKTASALIVAPWPLGDAALLDDAVEAQMGVLMDLVRGIRNVRAEYNVEPGKRISAILAVGELAPVLQARRPMLELLARLDGAALTITAQAEAPAQSAAVVVGDAAAYLPLAGLVDLDAERARLQKALAQLEGHMQGSRAKLAGPFAQKAPAEVVEGARQRLAEMEAEAAQLREQLARLG